MLDLQDPLWRKLDDAHRDRDIPEMLRELGENWSKDEASSLFWDCLCHQDTCYGATFAAIPHVLAIAERSEGEPMRDIAFFLGHVARVAFQMNDGSGHIETTVPQGLPNTLNDWDRKLDPYRRGAQFAARDLADPNYPGCAE